MTRYLISFSRFSLTIQFKDAMFNLSGFVGRNTHQVDNRARPPAHQNLKRKDGHVVLVLRLADHAPVCFGQGIKIDR